MRARILAVAAVVVATIMLRGAAAAPDEAHQTPAEQPPTPKELVAAGQAWTLDTAHGHVHVWIPDGYDAETAATIVYVHGYYVDVDEAWEDQRLGEQFAISGLNALFIVCGAPEDASEPVTWPSLGELLETVRDGIGRGLPDRTLVAVGHSGAHRTLVHWLGERRLDTVVLVDAAYGELGPYRRWLRQSPRHRLIDIGADTRWRTDRFHRTLDETVTVNHFPSPDEGGFPTFARDARILYVRAHREHMQLVTDGVALPLTLRALRVPLVQGKSRSEPLQPLPAIPADDAADSGQS